MLTITATMIRWLDTCTRRVWRDAYIERERQDAPTMLTYALLNAGLEHEQQIQQNTAPQRRMVTVYNWADGVRLTQELMRQRVEVILGAYLEVTLTVEGFPEPIQLGGRVDRLERQPDGCYAPIEIKRYSALREGDALQLEFYVWLLCKLQEAEALPATFWLGADENGYPLNVIEDHYGAERFEPHLGALLQLLSVSEPAARLISDCKQCHWRSSCYPAAASRKHISLLSKISRKTLADLEAAGISKLEQIAAMEPDDLRQFRGIKSTANAVHASARAWVEERAVWYGQLHQSCHTHADAFYFDIETLQNEWGGTEVWSIGWSGADGQVRVIIVAPEGSYHETEMLLPDGQPVTLVPDAASAWLTFARVMGEGDQPIFHWTGYDAGVMRKSAPVDVTAQLAPRLADLCALFDRAVKLPVKGVSLKTVARHFGFNWQGYDDWFAAYSDYMNWRRSGNEKMLASACRYQSDDVVAMQIVRRWLAENAPESSRNR